MSNARALLPEPGLIGAPGPDRGEVRLARSDPTRSHFSGNSKPTPAPVPLTDVGPVLRAIHHPADSARARHAHTMETSVQQHEGDSMRRHHYSWTSCGDAGRTAGPESLTFGLSVVYLVIAIIVVLTYVGGR